MAAGDIKIFSEKHNPRKAVVLEGGDDAIQVDAWGTDRQTAADTVGTIAAWVMPETKTSTYTILAAGDADGDEFIDFSIVSGKLNITVSDAATTDLDVETDAVVVEPHVWTHVAIVQDATAPKLYVNGVLSASTNDVSNDLTSWFDQMSTIDVANIGYLEANSTTTQDFVGGVGRVRHWNAALTAAELLKDVQGVAQSAATDALQISSWEWDGDFTDDWAGSNDGTVVSAAVLDPFYTNMTSQLKFVSTVVADDISISMAEGKMFAVVIKAA